MPKYYIDPNKTGGQPVSQLYDTINYLSGLSGDGVASTTPIINEVPVNFNKEASFKDNVNFTSGAATATTVNFGTNVHPVINENTVFKNGLSVTGKGVFNGEITFKSNAIFEKGLNTASQSTSTFLGTAIFDSKAYFNKGAIIGSSLSVTGPFNATSSATFDGKTTFNEKVTFAKGFTSIADSDITGAFQVTGNATIKGDLTANRVWNAVYNDYAELFPRLEDTEPGDIIALAIEQEEEGYRLAHAGDKLLVGVHSDQFAHLIGGEIPDNGEDFITYNLKKFIPIGLAGRVKVNVKAPIQKGDKITISDIPGIGRKANEGEQAVGYALEDFFDYDSLGKISMKII